MVLQHGILAEEIAVDVRVLLDDARVGQCNDGAAQLMASGMTKREGHNRPRLPPACRDGEREEARRKFGGVEAGPVDVRANAVDLGRSGTGQERCLLSLQFFLERFDLG